MSIRKLTLRCPSTDELYDIDFSTVLVVPKLYPDLRIVENTYSYTVQGNIHAKSLMVVKCKCGRDHIFEGDSIIYSSDDNRGIFKSIIYRRKN